MQTLRFFAAALRQGLALKTVKYTKTNLLQHDVELSVRNVWTFLCRGCADERRSLKGQQIREMRAEEEKMRKQTERNVTRENRRDKRTRKRNSCLNCRSQRSLTDRGSDPDPNKV